MRRRFSAAHTSLNSQRTLSMPLKLNCRNPSTCLIQALGGSTMALRRRYFALPGWGLQLGCHRRRVRVLVSVDLRLLLAFSPQRHDHLNLLATQLRQHSFAAIARIREQDFRHLAGVALDRIEHRRQQRAVGGAVAQLCRHDDRAPA